MRLDGKEIKREAAELSLDSWIDGALRDDSLSCHSKNGN